MQKLSLSKRLRVVNNNKMKYPVAFYIFVDYYFDTLSQMSGSEYYSSLYNDCLKKYCCWDDKIHVLSEAITTSLSNDNFSPQERMELLYRVLIEPFVDTKVWEKEGENYTCNPI